MRVTDVRQTPHGDPTHRVRTTKADVEEIVAADDSGAAIREKLRTGQIRVERVVRVLGLVVAVGIEEAVLGTGAITLAALAVNVAVGGPVSVLQGAIRWVVRAVQWVVRTLWRNIMTIAAGLTIIEKLGLLDRLKRAAGKCWNAIRKPVGVIERPWLRSSTTEDNDE